MRGWLFSSFLIPLYLSAQSPSALEKDPQGWQDIFPPATLKGWTRVPIPPTAQLHPEPQWKVDSANRVLICEGDKGHEWLRYDQELGDFIFHVEFRFVPLPAGTTPAPRYNSGIFARNSADGAIWHQAQAGGGSGGFLFGVSPVQGEAKRMTFNDKTKPSRVKPAGEWNAFEITAKGNQLVLWVNGAVTSEWNNLEVLKGYIGLEAEGYRIEFRNLKLKKL
jgi:hypothetical protein